MKERKGRFEKWDNNSGGKDERDGESVREYGFKGESGEK